MGHNSLLELASGRYVTASGSRFKHAAIIAGVADGFHQSDLGSGITGVTPLLETRQIEGAVQTNRVGPPID